jgi:elongation factor Ts
MHVAASSPMAVTPEELDPQAVERERAIFAEQARGSGKPENIVEKMVDGRMRKFHEESVLLAQTFVIDGERTVAKAVDDTAKEIGAAIEIAGFVRLALGEGVDRDETDFAAEVAAAAGV